MFKALPLNLIVLLSVLESTVYGPESTFELILNCILYFDQILESTFKTIHIYCPDKQVKIAAHTIELRGLNSARRVLVDALPISSSTCTAASEEDVINVFCECEPLHEMKECDLAVRNLILRTTYIDTAPTYEQYIDCLNTEGNERCAVIQLE